MLLRTAFIYELILIILPDDHIEAVCKSTPVAVVKHDDVSTNTVFKKENTFDDNVNTYCKVLDDQASTPKQSNTARVSKQRLPTPLSVTPIMLTSYAKGLLYSYPDPNLGAIGRLPENCTAETISNCLFLFSLLKKVQSDRS